MRRNDIRHGVHDAHRRGNHGSRPRGHAFNTGATTIPKRRGHRAVDNPQLWHWPEDWPLVSLSPTVEPFLVIGYIMFYLGPYFPAIWILRKLQARRPVDSFVGVTR